MIDKNKFLQVYNNTEAYPKVSDVAKKLGINERTVRYKAALFRVESPELVVNRSNIGSVPMSENASHYYDDWTQEDCIAELQRIAKIDEDRVVTRNYFRVHSKISEATWNRYFGTFAEFKRQAGITLNRQQHNLERQIAKHASLDHYRALNEERESWSGKYERENNRRFKSVLAMSDLHDIEMDPFWWRVALDTAKRAQPDVICLTGDVFDLPEFGKYGVDPREWDVVKRIKFVHDNILAPLREACPDAQIDLVEGNHENRLMRHLADATPALRTVLSDLHGFTVSKLLGLDTFEVNYVAKADLAAYTKRDMQAELNKNYRIYWDCFVAHHFPHARNMSMPGWNGHHHVHQVWSGYNPMFQSYEWHQLGGGHVRQATYTEGEKWSNGFLIANCDVVTKATSFDYIQTTDFAISGGKWYHRQENEGSFVNG